MPDNETNKTVNISCIKRLQMEAEAARAFLQTVIDNIEESIMVIRPDYRIDLMNKSARTIFIGDAPMPDSPFCFELSHRRSKPCDGTDDPCPVKKVLAEKKSVTVTHRHFSLDGQEFFVEILASPVFDENGNVVKIIESCRDITDKLKFEKTKKQLEERIRNEQKEHFMLTLAGGIAHDFNNALMGVLGNAELLLMKLPQKNQEREFVQNIEERAQYMADLTRQLLAYAKGSVFRPKLFSLNNSIRGALSLCHKGKALAVEVVSELSADLCPVFADPSQMDHVFMNIFTNAFESMEKTGGHLLIKTFNALNMPDWECQPFHHEHPAGDYVSVVISDTGSGIPSDMLQKVFDPFVTSKFLGRGLGLAAAAGIIQAHHGCITAGNTEDGGAVFQIYMPCSRVAPEPVHSEAETDEQRPAILIVDDEPQVLSVQQEMLNVMGYRVLSFCDSVRSLEVFRQKKNSIKLAIIDLQMPELDGHALFRELKAINPELKVIISTGYDEIQDQAAMGQSSPEYFIQKPYKWQEFERIVRTLMD